MKKLSFPPEEKKAIAGLAAVIGLRMFGLSTLIPVFSIYALSLPEATPLLAGLAFGIYGLTQAVLQIPFGYFSDRFGRRPVVAIGLAIFGVGSVVAALTSSIYILILARFLQGAGAIASACFAWIADLTAESRRNIAMAFMGISVGGGIMMGMIFGPMMGGAFGVPFLFWLAAALSALGIFITLTRLKEPERTFHENADFALDPKVALKYAATPDLLKLDVAGFLVNMSMITTFFLIPLQLAETFSMTELWKLYLPFGFFGAATMGYCSRKADAGSARTVIVLSYVGVALAFLVFALAENVTGVIIGFGIFFTAFSVLEATLPAAVSKLADPVHKGAIIGAYNFSQFMGTFFGGVIAGAIGTGHGSLLFGCLAIANIFAALLVRSTSGVSPLESEPVVG